MKIIKEDIPKPFQPFDIRIETVEEAQTLWIKLGVSDIKTVEYISPIHQQRYLNVMINISQKMFDVINEELSVQKKKP